MNYSIIKCFSGGRIKNWVPLQRWLSAPAPGQLVTWCVFVMIAGDAVVSASFATAHIYTFTGKFIVTVFGTLVLLSFALICLHEQSNASISFKVAFLHLRKMIGYNVKQQNKYRNWYKKVLRKSTVILVS